MVMVTIALVMAVIVTNIYAKKDIPQRCPPWTIRLAERFYPAHFLPPRPRQRGGTADTVESYSYNYPTTRKHVGDKLAITETDLDSTTACICCCLCHGNRRESDVTAPSYTRQIKQQEMFGGVTVGSELFDYERSEAEWRMVAKFTDRVFFWLFLALSLCTHTSLFMQMVPETRSTID